MKYSEGDLNRGIDLVLYNKYKDSTLSVFKLWIRNCVVLDQCALMNFYINFPNYILITYDAWDRGSFDKIALYGNDI